MNRYPARGRATRPIATVHGGGVWLIFRVIGARCSTNFKSEKYV